MLASLFSINPVNADFGNPDFETGAYSPWATFNNYGGTGLHADYAYNSDYGVKIYTDHVYVYNYGYAGIRQYTTLTDNNYLSWDMKIDDYNNPDPANITIKFRIRSNTNQYVFYEVQNMGTAGWQTYEVGLDGQIGSHNMYFEVHVNAPTGPYIDVFLDNIHVTNESVIETSINFNPDDEITTYVPEKFNYTVNSTHSPFIVYAYLRQYSDVGTYPYNYTGTTDTFMGFLELEASGNETDAIFGNATFSYGPVMYYGKRADMLGGCMESFSAWEPYAASLHMFMTACSDYTLEGQLVCYNVPPFGQGTQIAYDSIEINESYEPPEPPLPPVPNGTQTPYPTQTQTPFPTETPTPIPTPDPDPGDNVTYEINSSFMGDYYIAVDGVFDNATTGIKDGIGFLASPVFSLTEYIITVNDSLNESFSQSVGYKSVLVSIMVPFFSYLPASIQALITLSIIFILILLILRGNSGGQ